MKRRVLFNTEMDMREYIGAQVKDARENADMNPRELAAATRIGYESIIAIEAGSQTPTMWTVCRICDACNTTPDQLLGIPEITYTHTRNLLIAWACMDPEQKRAFLEYGRQLAGIEVAA